MVPLTEHDQTELAAALALALVPGIGPQSHDALVAHFGSAAATLAASRAALAEVVGLGPQLIDRIRSASLDAAREEIESCRAHQIEILRREDPRIPRRPRGRVSAAISRTIVCSGPNFRTRSGMPASIVTCRDAE